MNKVCLNAMYIIDDPARSLSISLSQINGSLN